MPTLISHAIVGATSSLAVSNGKVPRKFTILAIICAMVPDIDGVAFKLGIPYADFWGHRGFLHSLIFALAFGFAVTLLCYRRGVTSRRAWWLHLLFFAMVTASHGLLDALTNGGLGIALFAPFDNARLFFPYRPIAVSPISPVRLFSSGGWHVLVSESLWILLPALLIVGISRLGARQAPAKID